ncbi:MAG: hypothetical protein JXA30_13310 [Deltaproteobacteria bacterium]|nr:hypothetical protein [Deltaproteobacteria bacterium]
MGSRLQLMVLFSGLLCGLFFRVESVRSQDQPGSEVVENEPARAQIEEQTEAETVDRREASDTRADQLASEKQVGQIDSPESAPASPLPSGRSNKSHNSSDSISQDQPGEQSVLTSAATQKKGGQDDEWPKTRIRARIMTGWEFEEKRPSESQSGLSGNTSEQQLFLQQVRIGIKARLNKRVAANISADLSDAVRPKTSSSDLKQIPYLRNAYLNLRLKRAFQIRAGHFKRPFSKLENTSTGSLPFRGRGLSNALVIEEARWGDRAIGLMLWGEIREIGLTWKGSVSNPDWSVDNDSEMPGIDSIGQLVYKPNKWFSVGLNYGHKFIEPSDDQSINAHALGGDCRLTFGAFRITAEAFGAQLPEEEDHPFALGVTGYSTYDVDLIPDLVLQPTLFGEYADAHADYSQTEALRIVIGINLLWHRKLRVFPQVEIIRPVGTVSSLNPWISGETYYIMLSLEI